MLRGKLEFTSFGCLETFGPTRPRDIGLDGYHIGYIYIFPANQVCRSIKTRCRGFAIGTSKQQVAPCCHGVQSSSDIGQKRNSSRNPPHRIGEEC